MNGYPKEIEYPLYIIPCANIIGMMRHVVQVDLKGLGGGNHRGEWSGHVHAGGVKGELIARHVCWEKKEVYEAAPLLGSRPFCGPDLVVKGKGYDCKMIRDDSGDLLVNKWAHENPEKKGITHYWFFQDIGFCKARYWVFSREAVSGWGKYSDAYYWTIPVVLPLEG
jgi:hypothetical protein